MLHKQSFITVIMFIVFILLPGIVPAAGAAEQQPYILDADNITYDYQQGQTVASGHVQLEINGLTVECEELILELQGDTIQASGDEIDFTVQDQEIEGTYLNYNYRERSGVIYGARTSLQKLHFAGGIIKLVPDQPYNLEVSEASLTTCNQPDPHYQIKADQIKVYPEDKIVAHGVQFWLGGHKLFSLPGYVLDYDPDLQGFINSVPLPRLGYNSKDGLIIHYYAPYQPEGWPVEVFTELRVETGTDDSSGTEPEQLLRTGVKYKWNRSILTAAAGYDFFNHQRQEEINLDYRPGDDYRVNLDYLFNDEQLARRSASISHQGRIDWELQKRTGYETDYLPYLSLQTDKELLPGMKVQAGLGVGQVRNQGITADKIKVDLDVSKTLRLTPRLTLNTAGRVTSHQYFTTVDASYLVYQAEMTGRYQYPLNKQLNINTALGYQITGSQGQALLDVDREETGEKIHPVIGLVYSLPEQGSSWEVQAEGSYRLYDQSWDEAGVSLTRRFDCYSYSLKMDLLNRAVEVSLDF